MAIEVKVRCAGKMHRIVLADNGQLRLCDHNRKEDAVMAELAGSSLDHIRCYEVLKYWREAGKIEHLDPLPGPLKLARKIIKSHNRGQRLLRKKCKLLGRPFMDMTPTTVALNAEAIQPNYNSNRSLSEVRKPAARALLTIVDELKSRGYNAGYELGSAGTSEYEYYFTCRVNKVGKYEGYSLMNVASSPSCRIEQGAASMPVMVEGTNVTAPFGLAADIVEMLALSNAPKSAVYATARAQAVQDLAGEMTKRYKNATIRAIGTNYEVSFACNVTTAIGAGTMARAIDHAMQTVNKRPHHKLRKLGRGYYG